MHRPDLTSAAARAALWTPEARRRARWRGVARSLAAVAAMLAFGLAWAGAAHLGAAAPAAPAYPDPGMEEETEAPQPPLPDAEIWLVDGFNVLHAGVLRGRDRAGWWKAGMQARMVERAAAFERPEAEIWVVFDAARPDAEHWSASDPGAPAARVRVVHTPSADDWLVRRARTAPEPARIAVVTSDRQVAGRCRHAGVHVVSPRRFLARCGLA